MKINHLILVLFLSVLASCSRNSKTVAISDQINNPSTQFALTDLYGQLSKAGYTAVSENGGYAISVQLDTTLGNQAYRLQSSKDALILKAGDAVGAMYGLFDLSEQMSICKDLSKIETRDKKPFIEYRGIKMNIPLDGRLPSYDDTGDAAQKNVAEMWNIEFWHEFLDGLAKDRYNLLTLWSQHPFPAMVKLDEYPGAELEDVCVYNKEIPYTMHRNWEGVDLRDMRNFTLVKKMTIEEKIEFWQDVMKYAHDRGIEIMWFTWNIFITPGDPKYNFAPESPKALTYMYKSVKKMLETYPYLSGFGVTAGEKMGKMVGNYTNAQWLWEAYGKAVADVKREHPERPFRFIFRQHQTTLSVIDRDFTKTFPGKVETEYKYSIDHMYSSTKPPMFNDYYYPDVKKYNYQCWMHVRNDDIFSFRWGNPDYVREYLKNMMIYPVPGFFIGSDGYVWGREFISKNPKLAGELEIKKHWYPYLLWGRLAYDPEIPDAHFSDIVVEHFPETNGALLFDAWRSASKVIPLVNNFHWQSCDQMWSVEGCLSDLKGFLSVRDFIDSHTMERTLLQDIPEYVDMLIAGQSTQKVTPLQVADSLRLYADVSFRLLESLEKDTSTYSEALKATLGDIACQAWYGEYYAAKIAAATYLHMYECLNTESKATSKEKALEQIQIAIVAWEKMAAIADRQYKPQSMSRTRLVDWKKSLPDVRRDAEIIEHSTGVEPKVSKMFVSAGAQISANAKEKLVNALKKAGYRVDNFRAYELDGHATGLKFVFFMPGDNTSIIFRGQGGTMPDAFEQVGYAIVPWRKYNFVMAKDTHHFDLIVDQLVKEINSGELSI